MEFESVAKTNTTHTNEEQEDSFPLFESVAKTNTTHTDAEEAKSRCMFESVAKTNTTHTYLQLVLITLCLRVLLKQILPTPDLDFP